MPLVATDLSLKDRLYGCLVRWGINRMNYPVRPGLYGVNQPGQDSPVLVTCNYKLTFDCLRRCLGKVNAWILALDSKGINVWCAAGKKTMSTDNLVKSLAKEKILNLVNHRQLILPQLAGPGVAAHLVKKAAGFRVIYGPVAARHIPEFLANGFSADQKMREKGFGLYERAVLTPMELLPGLRLGLPLAAVVGILTALLWPGAFLKNLESVGALTGLYILWSLFQGTVLGPLLLPWLPGRAFAAKGWFLGLPGWWAYCLAFMRPQGFDWLLLWPLLPLGASLVSFSLMNFTGASTFTSMTGVEKEIKAHVPRQALALGLGLAAWLLMPYLG